MTRAGAGRRRAQGKPIGKRRLAREMAIQMLYQLEIGGCPPDEVYGSFDLSDFVVENEPPPIENADGGDDTLTRDALPPEAVPTAALPPGAKAAASKPRPKVRFSDAQAAFSYARTLVSGMLENAESIDDRIRRHAENWRLERMPMIDRNILRIAIFEMLYQDGVPKVVIVDEAIELAKKFGAENSSRFVNGLLDGVLKANKDSTRAKTAAAADVISDDTDGGDRADGSASA